MAKRIFQTNIIYYNFGGLVLKRIITFAGDMPRTTPEHKIGLLALALVGVLLFRLVAYFCFLVVLVVVVDIVFIVVVIFLLFCRVTHIVCFKLPRKQSENNREASQKSLSLFLGFFLFVDQCNSFRSIFRLSELLSRIAVHVVWCLYVAQLCLFGKNCGGSFPTARQKLVCGVFPCRPQAKVKSYENAWFAYDD